MSATLPPSFPATESTVFYQQLFECSPDAMLVFALNNRQVLAANPSLLAFIGRSESSSLIGRPVDLLLGPDHADALRDSLQALIHCHGTQAPAEPHHLRWDERVIELRLGWPPVEFFAQAACVLSMHDVSEQARCTHALERHQAQLESLVEERTAALHEVATANQAKRLFISNMSHELRTPLNAILGFSRLLERDPAMTDEHRQKLGAIHRAGEILLALINDVLEISRSDPHAAQPPATVLPLRERLAEKTSPPYLLVVDDQEDNRWLASHLLESAGCTVATAKNGEEAIAAVLARPPDLIWMDMRMPVLDGYEATRRIRALPGGEQIPIIAMTANTLPEERAAILAAGCNSLVGKPLDEAEVLSALKQWLGVPDRDVENTSPEPPGTNDLKTVALPTHYRIPLTQAAEMLDLEACREIAGAMQSEAPAAAAHLLALLAQFRFDQIVLWCKPS